MNRRQAKKVLKKGYPYTDLQLFHACLRLARYHQGRDPKREIEVLSSIPYAFIEVDGALDLRKERLEGRNRTRGQLALMAMEPPIQRGPVYRRDGQIHNFNVRSDVEGEKDRMTRKRYEARYAGNKPVPKYNVGRLQD